MAFTLLFVCTGNICRSPMAERLFLANIDRRLPVRASSAGTSGLTGLPMDAPSAQALRELGVDPEWHRGRRLTPELISGADLILTADTSHRSMVVQVDPSTFRTTFTIREFQRLGATIRPRGGPLTRATLRDRVAEVAAQRGHTYPPAPGHDDIRDPFGGTIDAARACAAQVAQSVDAVIATFGLWDLPS